MTQKYSASKEDAFTVEGKLALPYQYFAGRTGSKFIKAIRDEKKILGVKCDKCDKVYIPPRSTCERHPTDKCDEWVELGDCGVVTGFTIVRYKEPHQPVDPPYILALIKLDGADTPFAHIVKGVALQEMRTDLRVKAVFADEPSPTIMGIDHFKPCE